MKTKKLCLHTLLSLLALLCICLPSSRALAAGPEKFYGMVVPFDTNIATADQFLDDVGVKTCRLWADYSYASRSNTTNNGRKVFDQARSLKARGYTVILLVHNRNNDTYANVKAFYDWARDYRGPSGTDLPMKDVVDYWEVVNELNIGQYWNSSNTPAQYVNNILKAAWDSLSPAGEKVIGGSFTALQKQTTGNTTWADSVGEADVAQAYVNAGYLNYCHYAGLHPYTDGVTRMQNVINAHKSIYGSKPIIITEWNFHTQSDENKQRDWLNQVRPFVKNNVEIACFYRFTVTDNYYGITDYAPNSSYVAVAPFYAMYKNWPKGGTALPVGVWVRLQNEWSGNYLRATGSQTTGGPVNHEAIQSTWTSPQWMIEDAGGGYYRLKNQWSGLYLRAQGDQTLGGVVNHEAIQPTWSTPKWTMELISGNQYRLNNLWSGLYLRAKSDGTVEHATSQPEWVSPRWNIEIVQ